MFNFSVDKSLCAKCYICVRECPTSIIYVDKESQLPYITKYTCGEICIDCCHCAIMCPTGAAMHKEYAKEAFKKVDINNFPGDEQVKVLLLTKRSTRQYKDMPVPHHVIEEIMQIVRYAPTGVNGQPIRWVVCEDIKTTVKVREIVNSWYLHMYKENPNDPYFKKHASRIDRGIDTILRGAPQFIFSLVKNTHPWKEDGIIGLCYFSLVCHAMGFATCWGGLLQDALTHCQSLRNFLGIKNDEHVCNTQLFGYPELEVCDRIPYRKTLYLKYL